MGLLKTSKFAIVFKKTRWLLQDGTEKKGAKLVNTLIFGYCFPKSVEIAEMPSTKLFVPESAAARDSASVPDSAAARDSAAVLDCAAVLDSAAVIDSCWPYISAFTQKDSQPSESKKKKKNAYKENIRL